MQKNLSLGLRPQAAQCRDPLAHTRQWNPSTQRLRIDWAQNDHDTSNVTTVSLVISFDIVAFPVVFKQKRTMPHQIRGGQQCLNWCASKRGGGINHRSLRALCNRDQGRDQR